MTANEKVFALNCISTSRNGCLYSITEDDGNVWACGKMHDGLWIRPSIAVMDKNTEKTTEKTSVGKHILILGNGCLHSIIDSSDGNIWACGYVSDSDSVYDKPFFMIVDKDTKEVIVQKCILTPFNGCLYSAIFPTKNTGSSMWMCGEIYVGSHDKPFIINVGLTNLPSTCSLIKGINLGVKETKYTVESAFYPVVDSNYSIESTSYAIEIVEER